MFTSSVNKMFLSKWAKHWPKLRQFQKLERKQRKREKEIPTPTFNEPDLKKINEQKTQPFFYQQITQLTFEQIVLISWKDEVNKKPLYDFLTLNLSLKIRMLAKMDFRLEFWNEFVILNLSIIESKAVCNEILC
jgi:hypothetical protein